MPKLLLTHFYWVAASLFITFIPFLFELPIWIILSMATLIAINIKLKQKYKSWPKGSFILLISAYCMGIYYQFGTLLGQDVAIVLLITMVSLKFLESKTQRELSTITLLTFVLTLANYLYSQSIQSGIFMIFLVWFNGVVLISLNAQSKTPDLKYRFKLSGQILLQSLPIMLILFILFPRLSGPLWGIPESDDKAISGLSESMTPGKLSNLTKSAEVAFRVKFDDNTIPPPNKLYWRGPVLWNFDGKTWTHGKSSFVKEVIVNKPKNKIDYTVTMQPSGQNFVFVLDIPTNPIKNTQLNQEYQLISKKKILSLKQYQASSYLEYQINPSLSSDNWQLIYGLELPKGFNPKTIAYGKSLKKKYKTNREIINAALDNYNKNNFYYTLNPRRLGKHFSDDFLFNTKKGFCEHYASSFVITMRAAGIPARIVTGYLGGEINKFGDNYMIVRQSDAHAWTEIWLKNQGWVRIDPTGAVSPERVEQGIDAALPASEDLSIFSRRNAGLLKRIQLTWDAINNQWNYWVLGYGPKNQEKLLKSLGLKWSWQDMIIAIMILSFSVIALVFLYLMYQTRPLVSDPAFRFYNQFLKKCQKKGITIRKYEGPSDFSKRASIEYTDYVAKINLICKLYINIRYANNYSNKNLLALKSLIKGF